MNYCKVCLKDVVELTYCEVCGDTRLCKDCADECAELDADLDELWEG